ncbi:unnamed protein product, partial [Ceratitis capitata]
MAHARIRKFFEYDIVNFQAKAEINFIKISAFMACHGNAVHKSEQSSASSGVSGSCS